MDGWKSWEGKRVFVKLKRGREYTGRIISVEDVTIGKHDAFITLIDRYEKQVLFASSEVKIIQEEALKK